jgi:hypothetical protein
MTYERIFEDVDSYQVVLVSGEQDNEFSPGEPPPEWEGMEEAGSVVRDEEHRFETPMLAAGAYSFEMTGTRDADLYVRVGDAPTTSRYDCRPYSSSSNETCTVELGAPVAVHVMVRGWADSSEYRLIGR